MFTKIMTPVDLAHLDKLGKALDVTADLAKHFGIPVCYVGVTASAPSGVAHTPEEYAAKLAGLGREQAAAHGIETSTKAYQSHDPAIDLDNALMTAVQETGADLVVMASHNPNVTDFIWPSHGGQIASHSGASVFLVR